MVCVAILLIIGVLYFMKRVEANRLGAELDMTKVRHTYLLVLYC